MGNKGHEGVREIKGKVQVIYRSHSHKEATIRSSPPGTSYIILLCIAKKLPDQRNPVK